MLTMFKRLASLVPTPATNKVTLFVSDTGVPSYKNETGNVFTLSGQPTNLSGTYSARPAAGTVPVGTVYYATDVLEQYVTNGSAWSVYGGAGVVRGYAETSSSFTVSSTTLVDVPGMTTTVLQGERPLLISWGASLRSASGGTLSLALVINGTQVSQVVYGGASYQYSGRTMRYTATPGTSSVIKLQALITSGSGEIYGGSGDRPFLLSVNG